MSSRLSKSVWLLWKRVECLEALLRKAGHEVDGPYHKAKADQAVVEVDGPDLEGEGLSSSVGVVARPCSERSVRAVTESATAQADAERTRATTPTDEDSPSSCPRPEAGELSV